MIARFHQMAASTEGRYPTADEKQTLLDLAKGLPARIKAAEAVEAAEDKIVRGSIAAMQRKYPNFPKNHDQGWAKCYRDVQLVLRYVAQAALHDSKEMLDEKLLYWMRTILIASNFTPQLVRDAYTGLRDNCKQGLPAEAFALLEPFLEHTIAVLADIPEPAAAAV
jgi:hypothetical protein